MFLLEVKAQYLKGRCFICENKIANTPGIAHTGCTRFSIFIINKQNGSTGLDIAVSYFICKEWLLFYTDGMPSRPTTLLCHNIHPSDMPVKVTRLDLQDEQAEEDFRQLILLVVVTLKSISVIRIACVSSLFNNS